MATALVVDDAADVRDLIATVLGRAGFTVTCAAGGVEALELLRAGARPDVAILDVQMPEIDGWSTLAEVRADPRTAGLPVVLCTVKASADDRERGRSLGCDAFLTKPFSITDLVAAVSAVLPVMPDSSR